MEAACSNSFQAFYDHHPVLPEPHEEEMSLLNSRGAARPGELAHQQIKVPATQPHHENTPFKFRCLVLAVLLDRQAGQDCEHSNGVL